MYVLYNNTTGEVDSFLTGSVECLISNVTSGLSSLQVPDDTSKSDIWYVLNGELTAKPTQSTTVSSTTLLANGVDTITISNAPANSLLTLTNVVTGETVMGTFSNTEDIFSVSAGKLLLTIECFPYLDYTIELEAQ